ncbi:MAG: exosortase C-terminal domain/associated protein EpsI [Gemmatimonadales bacterium]
MTIGQRWTPAAILFVGFALNGVLIARRATSTPLRAPITRVAPSLLGAVATDDTVDTDQRLVAGMTNYVFRVYTPAGRPTFSVYVGYYDEQHQGKTIHSPKNCLPAAGWEPVDAGVGTYPTASGPVTINRYRIANGGEQALVYYWYQGRGRVAHDELRVKYELFRDAVLRGRTEEALVRIVVPLSPTIDAPAADRLAHDIVPTLVHDVYQVVPAW